MHQMNKHLHYHQWLKSEIMEIYLNLGIRSFALSLGGIFIPIYLYNLGYNLDIILEYYIITFVTFGVGSLMLPKLSRIGLKHLIMISISFHIAFFIMMYMLNNVNVNMLYGISIIGGLGQALYWTPLHSLFAKFSQKKKTGQQVSYIFSLPGLVSIIGPVIGGAIIFAFGFKILLIAISILLFISFIPLSRTKDFKPHKSFSFKEIMNKDHRQYFLGFFLCGMLYISYGVLWPLLVFFMLRNVVSLGAIGTIVAVGVVLFPLILGRVSKKISSTSLFKIGGITSFIVFTLLNYVNSIGHIYIASFFIGISLILVEMPLYALAIKKVAKKNPLEFMIFRELAISIGRVATLIILLLVINKFLIGFSLSGITSLFALVA